jgi:hypothetical protein
MKVEVSGTAERIDRPTHQTGVNASVEEAQNNGSMICTRTDPGSAKLLRHDTPRQHSSKPVHVAVCGPLRAAKSTYR